MQFPSLTQHRILQDSWPPSVCWEHRAEPELCSKQGGASALHALGMLQLHHSLLAAWGAQGYCRHDSSWDHFWKKELSFPSSSTSSITDKCWGKKRKRTISFITKESWVWIQLATFFLIQLVTISSTILHFFLAFTTQKEAALWVKLVQKVLYVLEPACTLLQLLQNIGHNKWKPRVFFNSILISSLL